MSLSDEQVAGRLHFLQKRLEELRDGTVTQRWFIEACGLLRIIQTERSEFRAYRERCDLQGGHFFDDDE